MEIARWGSLVVEGADAPWAIGSSKHTPTVPFAGRMGVPKVGSLVGNEEGVEVGCSLLLVPPPPTETTGDEVGRLERRQAGDKQAGDRRQT